MASPRSVARIEARIRERVAYCLEFEIKDPRSGFITVTGVRVSSDLSVAKVSYTVMGTDADRSKVARMLEGASGFVRGKVGRVLQTRKIPTIRWMYDETVEIQENMANAIADALKRDREINPNAHPTPLPPADVPAASSEDDGDDAPGRPRTYSDFLRTLDEEDD